MIKPPPIETRPILESYYVTQDWKRYLKQGDLVHIVDKPHENVWIGRDKNGNGFSIIPSVLSIEPIQQGIPELKPRVERTSSKPLTQAEKLQLEYLNIKNK